MVTPNSSPPERKFVLVHIFGNMLDLASERRHSPLVEHFNVPWRINLSLCRRNLEFMLYCYKPRNVGNWSVKVKFDLKLVSVKGKCDISSTKYTYGSKAEFSGYGFQNFMSFESLKTYLIDGKVIAEAHVTIEEMTGIEAPKKLRNFDESAEKLSSIVLNIGDEKFYVLKKFLALQSKFFKSLFFGKPNKVEESEMALKDVDPQKFQMFLEVLYLEPSLTDSNIEDVLQLTGTFKSESGARLCEIFLICESKHTLRDKLRIACQYKLEKLKKHCFDSIKSPVDVRSVVGPNVSVVDPLISAELIKKLFLFSVESLNVSKT